MKRPEFEHAIRAAAAILGIDQLLIIGSQAIHASLEKPFTEAMRSIEVDIAVLKGDYESSADLIDGSIGELSMFQETFGYYAQGVVPSTAVLPSGWRKRLIPYKTAATEGVTALCLEPHDLWISKVIAGREKDGEFCDAMIRRGMVDKGILFKRLKTIKGLAPETIELVIAKIDKIDK